MNASLEQNVARFHFDYADTLNAGRYDEWPSFFAVDDCDYRVVSRENHDAGLPTPLMGCFSHGMMKDRVAMLVKKTLTFQKSNLRHYITNVRVDQAPDGLIAGRANVLVMQSDLEGNSAIYLVGRYEDTFVTEADGALKLKRRLVILDSFSIVNMLAVPL